MSEPPEKRPEREQEPSPEPEGLERWIRPYFEDMALWPVLLVGLIALATLGASVLFLALGARNPFAIVALLVLAIASVEAAFRDFRRRRRLGLASALIGTLWLLAAGVAAGATFLGLF